MRKPRDLDIDLSGAKVLTTKLPALDAVAPARTGVHVIKMPNWRPATINDLFHRGNHFRAGRLKRIDRELIAAHAMMAGIPQATTKRRVSLRITLAGRMKQCDPDAFWKSTLDGLVAARMLIDDSPDWVELGTVEQVGGDRKATRITLEDL